MDANFASWRLTPVTTTKGKSALIGDSLCQPVHVDTKSFLKVPYNAGSFDPKEMVRFNLDLALNDELRDFLLKLDDFIIGALAQDSELYFKKKTTEQEIRNHFKPSVTKHEKDGVIYSDTVRTKINVLGPRAVKCWSVEKFKMEIPEDWRTCTCRAIIVPKSVWFMGQNNLGVTFEVHNCVLDIMDETCPF